MRRFLAACLFTVLATTAHAAETPGDVALYAGQFAVIDDDDYETVQGGIEYRWPDQFNGLRPVVGVWANGDGATYAYGGAYWDLPLGTEPFVITPGIQVGGYSQGSSKDLGYGIEFRDSIEITYRMDSGHRIGGSFTHMSNASLGDHNPGVEMWQIVYTAPVSF